MTLIKDYWYDDPSVPFGTFLNVVDTYCHPEADEEAYDELIHRARVSAPDDAVIHTFKRELVRLLEGEREGLHPQAIATAAQYSDGNDAFLRRLWRDLYPDEPLPSTTPTSDDR